MRRAIIKYGRGAALCTVGTLGVFCLMAHDGRLAHGALWGVPLLLLAVLGLLDLLELPSLYTELPARPLRSTAFCALQGEPSWMSPQVTVPVSLTILILGAALGGYVRLPWTLLGALLVLGVSGLRRPGLGVAVLASLLYLPLLGTYGLWDPWETHYGEVAREILSRDDWISLWWCQDGWFFSKPILIFWMEALSLSAFGVNFLPDGNPAHPEWAIRLPHYLIALSAIAATYGAIAKIMGKRAGFFAAFVLATTPLFFFLAHQAITDMPFVGTMTLGMACLIVALTSAADARVQPVRVGSWLLSLQHVIIGAVAMVSLSQILLLISRNLKFVPPIFFAWQRDLFLHGSAGNHGVAGNAAVYETVPVYNSPLDQPWVQGVLWTLLLAVVIWMLRKETRTRPLYMVAFYFFCGLSFIAKGIPGFALPGLIALLYLVSSRRWSLLLTGQFYILRGVLVIALVGVPWVAAMVIRHGSGFINRLLIHDHINRLASGVHGDTGSIQYFLTQLGYASFPWIGLLPFAIAAYIQSVRANQSSDSSKSDSVQQTWVFLVVWFFGAFTLFNAMVTKFHHYIFPAVPPLAILCGLGLERWTQCDIFLAKSGTRWLKTCALLAAPLFILGLACICGDLRGVATPELLKSNPNDWLLRATVPLWLGWVLLSLGVVCLGAVYFFARTQENTEATAVQPRATSVFVSASLIVGVLLIAFIGRDLAWKTPSRPAGFERLIHLFVYNYGRPWPAQFDYRAILTAFVIAASFGLLLALWIRLRAGAAHFLCATVFLFAGWCINVYLIDLSPHWSQRELVKKYYALRTNPRELLVAWQMNWKGENFYTGNRVHVYVDLDNKKVKEWITTQRGKKMFFLLEHTRLGAFRSLVAGRRVAEHTTSYDNNKFILVSVVL